MSLKTLTVYGLPVLVTNIINRSGCHKMKSFPESLECFTLEKTGKGEECSMITYMLFDDSGMPYLISKRSFFRYHLQLDKELFNSLDALILMDNTTYWESPYKVNQKLN